MPLLSPARGTHSPTSEFAHTGDGSAPSLAKILSTTDFSRISMQPKLRPSFPKSLTPFSHLLQLQELKDASLTHNPRLFHSSLLLFLGSSNNPNPHQQEGLSEMSPSPEEQGWSIPDPSTFPKAPRWCQGEGEPRSCRTRRLSASQAAQTFLCPPETLHPHPCRPSAGPGARPLHVELHQEPSPSPCATTSCPPGATESHRGGDSFWQGWQASCPPPS